MMIKTNLDVQTPDGVANCVAFRPDGAGPFPAVMFLFDAGGIRPAMEQMAERIAAQGYYVLLPNLYYRSGPFAPFNARTVFNDPPERARMGALIRSVTSDGAVRDMAAFLDALERIPEVRKGGVGLLGYCMGGRVAFVAAGALADRIAAAAVIHGGNLVTDAPDSPHLAAPRIRARLYFGVADNDASCTPAHQASLKAALDAAGVRYQLEVYSGALHGFAVPDFTVYDDAASEKHWERVLALFTEEMPAGISD